MQIFRFLDERGTFSFQEACRIKTLYFPLCNENILSCLNPYLYGDIKKDQNSFLLVPVSRIELINSRASRNFWVYLENKSIAWSITGVSKDLVQIKRDKFLLTAGLLWHKIERENKTLGLKAEVLNFVPASGEPVEIIKVSLKNISAKPLDIIFTCATPLYCRSAENIRDHRHVTSLLNRIFLDKYGIKVKPTLIFDERGHHPNKNIYFVFGWDQEFNSPEFIYPTQEIFCGEGDLEAPEAILNNLAPKIDPKTIQGKEALAGLRFERKKILPQQSYNYYFILGITEREEEIKKIIKKFKEKNRIENSLEETKNHWFNLADSFSLKTGDSNFDSWFLWVNIQPTLRRIYGCSFLPDFDYGKGGRGWRDLWQDCLALILREPQNLRKTLINNFSGVRIDGSNATIILKKELEFISDRNRISRVWMDHGVWPVFTLSLYLNETKDLDILFEETTYFRDHQIFRAQKIDYEFEPQEGYFLKTKKGQIYKGTILEHMLVQILVQFFNVGPHNFIRLENADWNDGLDLAPKFGESITFSSMYAYCLSLLAEILKKTSVKEVKLFKELSLFFKKINYNDIQKKRKLLWNYFELVKSCISGEKVSMDKEEIINDLENKSTWLIQHIRNSAWLKEGFYLGYFNENKKPVEGKINNKIRMMLASQVFPILSGVATKEQIERIVKSVKKYLWDKKLGGIHLNTDFGQEQLNLGRAFSFNYGDKENGAFFNHMVVMLSYALYKRGFIKDAWEFLSSIYKMAMSSTAQIYPCLPEYFDLEGRGKYLYLTGSASWFILTFITEVLGVKGKFGDLFIEPKLLGSQFKKDKITFRRRFAQREFEFRYFCRNRKERPLRITKAKLNSLDLIFSPCGILIERQEILKLDSHKTQIIEIFLE
ncbi:MAG: cellobiose phosphorylase [Candidatus Omnitrophica bacterium]|nr:cellobiose phosphorylase [Candidatus Omnitrophota bacterium]